MWIILLPIAIVGVYIFYQHPEEWQKNKYGRYVVPTIHLIGMLSFLILIYGYNKISSGVLRQIISAVFTYYFTSISLLTLVYLFRQSAHFLAKTFHWERTMKVLEHKRLISIIAVIIVSVLVPIGYYRIDDIRLTQYSISCVKSSDVESMCIALIADIHLGAGAQKTELEQAVKYVNSMSADIIVLAGDIVDGSTSSQDMEDLQQALLAMQSKYGIYYVAGNHDADSKLDYISLLKQSEVHILIDKSITLPNGVVLIGRGDKRIVGIETLLQQSGANKTDPMVVLQHEPKGLAELESYCDVVLSGHTHGQRYPWVWGVQNLIYDNYYGLKRYSDMTSVVTSGMSAWGIHFKLPAISEVVQIDLTFGG